MYFLFSYILISHVYFRSQEWHFIEAAPAGLHPSEIELSNSNIVVFRIRGDAGWSLWQVVLFSRQDEGGHTGEDFNIFLWFYSFFFRFLPADGVSPVRLSTQWPGTLKILRWVRKLLSTPKSKNGNWILRFLGWIEQIITRLLAACASCFTIFTFSSDDFIHFSKFCIQRLNINKIFLNR